MSNYDIILIQSLKQTLDGRSYLHIMNYKVLLSIIITHEHTACMTHARDKSKNIGTNFINSCTQ